MEYLNESIKNSWQGLFEIKDNKGGSKYESKDDMLRRKHEQYKREDEEVQQGHPIQISDSTF